MLIRTESVSHDHDGCPALRGVDLVVARGERVVLLGSNGSGKSTLLKLLDGLFEPDRGAVFYDGRRLDRAALGDRDFHRRFRREVVLLFQEPEAMLFHPSVAEELSFGPRQLELDDPEDRARQWAERTGVAHLWSRPPTDLSRGEKQRVALAAVLVLEPRVLLLDEPTAALDPRSTGWLVDFLQDLPVTTVTATHNLSLAPELGDRAVILGEDHTVLLDGAIAGLQEDLDLLRRANLVHRHRHRHGPHEHSHDHVHDWD
ncbi:ATP-binding cassette domain-containing protein [bacterium]|nr:ATP-binding cassette domain-containing protein [bacterium]